MGLQPHLACVWNPLGSSRSVSRLACLFPITEPPRPRRSGCRAGLQVRGNMRPVARSTESCAFFSQRAQVWERNSEGREGSFGVSPDGLMPLLASPRLASPRLDCCLASSPCKCRLASIAASPCPPVGLPSPIGAWPRLLARLAIAASPRPPASLVSPRLDCRLASSRLASIGAWPRLLARLAMIAASPRPPASLASPRLDSPPAILASSPWYCSLISRSTSPVASPRLAFK